WHGHAPRSSNFFGRHKEVWRLNHLLAQREFPQITEGLAGNVAIVSGGKGIGKTAMVANYCKYFESRYPGGIYWLDLASAIGEGSEGVREVFARQLGRFLQTEELVRGTLDAKQALARLSAYLEDAPGLLVMDNFPDSVQPDIIYELTLHDSNVSN